MAANCTSLGNDLSIYRYFLPFEKCGACLSLFDTPTVLFKVLPNGAMIEGNEPKVQNHCR